MSYNSGNNYREKRTGKTVALKSKRHHKNRNKSEVPLPDHMHCSFANLRCEYRYLFCNWVEDLPHVSDKEVVKPVEGQYWIGPANWTKSNSVPKPTKPGYVYWFRAMNGWIWTFNIKGSQGLHKVVCSGYVNFIYKKQIPQYYYISHNEYNTWFKVRQIQTFLCILKRLNYQKYVPKDIIKKIYNLI